MLREKISVFGVYLRPIILDNLISDETYGSGVNVPS
jgi:hypothetical protein